MALPVAELMTVGEVARMMRVSNMTVYRLIKCGDIGAVRVGKNYRIRKNDVWAYLMRSSVKAGHTDHPEVAPALASVGGNDKEHE